MHLHHHCGHPARPLRHFAACTALLLAAGTWAQGASPPAPGQQPMAKDQGSARDAGRLAGEDRAFMEQAAQNNHAEIEGSRLALRKAADPQVKAFAQRMVEEHSRSGQELQALAAAKGVALPTEPSLLQRARLKMLSTADGAKFDRDYSESVGRKAHRETIELFEKAGREVRDPDLKAFIDKTLPVLHGHAEMAQRLPAEQTSGTAVQQPPGQTGR